MIRVAWFPQTQDMAGNPYWNLLHIELEKLGVVFETTHNSFWLARRWLWQQRKRTQVLHFHFIQPQYNGANTWIRVRRLAKFASDLVLARLLGYRIVWTMHDLIPTWPIEPQWFDRLGRYFIAALANQVSVHCEEAKHLLAQHFHRRRNVSVMPHPGFAYPNRVTQAEARARLGIDQGQFVIGFVGGIRPNKGVDQLIQAFSQMHDPNVVLLIAGKPWPPIDYVEQLQKLAATDNRILFLPQAIPADEIQLYMNAANVIALPFTQVLTSGSLMLALSFGRPVIIPRQGCLPEMAGRAGILYDSAQPDGLIGALQTAMKSDLDQMGAIGAQRANDYTWTDLARATLKIYGDS